MGYSETGNVALKNKIKRISTYRDSLYPIFRFKIDMLQFNRTYSKIVALESIRG